MARACDLTKLYVTIRIIKALRGAAKLTGRCQSSTVSTHPQSSEKRSDQATQVKTSVSLDPAVGDLSFKAGFRNLKTAQNKFQMNIGFRKEAINADRATDPFIFISFLIVLYGCFYASDWIWAACSFYTVGQLVNHHFK